MFELSEPKTKKFRLKQIMFSFVVLSLLVSFSPVPTPQTAEAAYVYAPVFSPGSTTLTTKTKISLSSSTSGATIYYTFARGSIPSNPTTSSYRYSSTYGIDLQQSSRFYVGTYYVKAVAYYGGYFSAVTSATYTVTNKDQSSRNSLKSKSINVNKDDCWLANKTVCTSLVGMRSGTLSEIGYFAAACKSWTGSSTTNACGVYVTGGTEAGHSTGSCSHAYGYKFDMSPVTKVNNYIQTSGQFTKLPNVTIKGVSVAQYKWMSGGAIYTYEKNIPGYVDHWDVKVGC